MAERSYAGRGEIKEYGVSSYLSHKCKRKMEKIWRLMTIGGKFRQRPLSQRRLKPNYVNTKREVKFQLQQGDFHQDRGHAAVP